MKILKVTKVYKVILLFRIQHQLPFYRVPLNTIVISSFLEIRPENTLTISHFTQSENVYLAINHNHVSIFFRKHRAEICNKIIILCLKEKKG